jgi:hypothetical protein
MSPRKSWWQSMPWLVRAAVWLTALSVVLPVLVVGAFVSYLILWGPPR